MCDPPLKRLFTKDIQWYWVDFQSPTEEETLVLRDRFNFHYLAIEDCLNFLQRPKLEYYSDYNFFVLHFMNQQTLKVEEINVFLNHNFIVSFHLKPIPEVEEVRKKLINEIKIRNEERFVMDTFSSWESCYF